jgi:cytochrome c peroxidase
MFYHLLVYCLVIFITLFACVDNKEVIIDMPPVLNQIEVPNHFPDIIFPEGNEFTSDRWSLGKKLFYDKRLSIDSSISCANCHKQNLAFADDVALSLGVFNSAGVTNAPSLANVAYHPYYTREGGLKTLEMQVLVPISEHNEFGFNIVEIVNRLKDDIAYQEMAMKSYDRSLDPYVITRSISTFERSIISGGSKYDLFKQGKQALTAEEMAGKDLFFSDRTNCSSCHGGFNFTNYDFKNNGLYVDYLSLGRKRLTQKDEDLALFKTPSLRNAGLTAPYMHDGSLVTLASVIDHYNSGGKPHFHKSELIKPLGLTDKEKKALIAFLHTLDDQSLQNNSYLRE